MEKLLVIGTGFLGTAISNIAKTREFKVFEASQKNLKLRHIAYTSPWKIHPWPSG